MAACLGIQTGGRVSTWAQIATIQIVLMALAKGEVATGRGAAISLGDHASCAKPPAMASRPMGRPA